MKINLLITFTFISIVIYAGIDYSTGITGLTKRDDGLGCLCHNINLSSSVHVWIEGPDSVVINHTASYKLFMTGGPAVAGGFDLASYLGELNSVDTLTQVLFGELTHTSPNPFLNDTVSWNFLYTAPDSLFADTIYSVANSVNLDGIPNNLDQWNFGNNFVVHIIDNPVPVELSNFIVTANLNDVQISWTTLTETNNSGFAIERKTESSDWIQVTFIPGVGTSTEIHSYTYNDSKLQYGSYSYRLKQIDYDGSVFYSDVINIDVNVPGEFVLEQNYPNPFNPTTNIGFRISNEGFVSLIIYDVLGNEVAILVNEEKQPGTYQVEFSPEASIQNPASSIYLYQLRAGSFVETKKMLLLK
jgi:hypothetical protein